MQMFNAIVNKVNVCMKLEQKLLTFRLTSQNKLLDNQKILEYNWSEYGASGDRAELILIRGCDEDHNPRYNEKYDQEFRYTQKNIYIPSYIWQR